MEVLDWRAAYLQALGGLWRAEIVIDKKKREREILELVYDTGEFASVLESERPDFLLKREHDHSYFGVEVTTYYSSEAKARLRNIPSYFDELMGGGEARHKDDIDVLTPEPLDIITRDGELKASILGIVSRVPAPDEYVYSIADVITTKDQKLDVSRRDLSHVNLIIEDAEEPLLSDPKEFNRLLLTRDLRFRLGTTRFREVFLLTRLGRDDRKRVFVPLRQLSFLAELYLFNGAFLHWCSEEVEQRVADQLARFAGFMNDRGVPVSCVEDPVFGMEVRLGNTGIVVSGEWHVTVRDYRDDPQTPRTPVPTVVMDPEFEAAFEQFIATNTFSIPLAYPARIDCISSGTTPKTEPPNKIVEADELA